MVMVALPRPENGRRSPRLFATTALVVLLAGCSSVPDAVNPIEWYKGTRDFLIGEDAQTAQASSALPAAQQQATPGENKPIPSLSSVPQRPRTSSRAQRDAISRGLVADREQSRKYTSEVIPRQGQAVDPLRSAVAESPAPARAAQLPAVRTPEAAPRSAPPAAAPRRAAPVAPPPAAQPLPQVVARPSLPPAAPPPVRRIAPRPAPSGLVASAPPAAPRVATRSPIPSAPRAAISPPSASTTASRAPMPRLGTIRAPRVTPINADSGTIVVSSAGVQQLSNGGRLVAPIARPGAQPSRLPATQPVFNSGAGGSYQVATILFGNGSSRLSARDRQILRQVAAQARRAGGVIRVVGHASHRTKLLDPVKHKLTNLRVSSARADAVARELVKFGASPNSMVIGAASDAEPRYLEHMPTGEAGNRRADVFIDF